MDAFANDFYYFNHTSLNGARFNLFGQFDSSDSSKLTTVHSVYDNNNDKYRKQTVSTQTDNASQDMDQTNFYLNQHSALNMNHLLCQPIPSASKGTSETHEERGYAMNEQLPTSTSRRFINKKSEELKSNFCKEKPKRTRKTGRKLNLTESKNLSLGLRKLAHATAESKYRSSINEQIKNLKTLVAGPNVNWKKATILEIVAQYIERLREANSNLAEENFYLKLKLGQFSSVTPSPINTACIVMPAVTSLINNGIELPNSKIMYSCI